MMNKKKRKGSGIDDDDCENLIKTPINPLQLNNEDRGSIIRAHLSLEGCSRLKKKCKEDVGSNNVFDGSSCVRNRIVGVSTVPPSIGLSYVEPSRGLKRKIGCIDVATQIGSRKNKLEDDYVMIKTIGQGKFGSVWLCRCKATGREYACKTLKKGEETVHREVEIMQHLSGHPGVVMLNAVYEDSDCFHLVMELCSGGRLVDEMKENRCSEQRAAHILKELMLVIKYCHEMGVVHRDIKPENILLTSSGKMKLADFGLAVRVATGQSLTGVAGSPAYVAPEVLSGAYREKVDIWSAGILLHALLTGSLPFQGKSIETVFEAIKNNKLDFHSGEWLSVSKLARDLVVKMLKRDVSERISADEVLGHPFIMFYTERTLKSLSIKPNSRNVSVTPSHQSDKTSLAESHKLLPSSCPSNENLDPAVTTRHLVACDTDKQDDCGLMDVLVVAISQVRISEPKRSRLCFSESSSVQLQYSSNSLCKAF
ncbi:serine/threonine-protein kinase PEPKR2-like [Chenopodium quinoa]|uniref:Protein kinase domain-containing protein n=1 Tax=Chenopodium quinoa TaxID=63459 RepID=A0A803MEE7_CHEQI|nr:serine/threonine-protein kinase PEPKR2-like [Chenopodium quinoa]